MEEIGIGPIDGILSQERWLLWEEGVNISYSIIAKGQDNRSQTGMDGWPIMLGCKLAPSNPFN